MAGIKQLLPETGISGAVSGNATDGEHLVKHCFSSSASGKHIRVRNTKIKRKAMVNTYNGEGNLISQQEMIDEGAVLPRGKREAFGLRMIWGRVLSSMPKMQ